MAERKKIVVIDPGHGGTADLGGSSWQGAAGPGPNPILEKDPTLSLAKAVRQRISSICDVTLTRESDVNVSLSGRAKKARELHADLFLSIHFNAASDSGVDGTETWTATQASPASTGFARTVLKHVALATGAANRGVRNSDFGVLLPSRHDPGTAACLVEVAFLSNPTEASRLKDPVYFGQIADALAEAIRAHSIVALTHAVAAGAGAGSGWSSGTSVSLMEPEPVDDERYSESMSAAELERLFALPLDVVIKTVVDSDARIRNGPPSFALQGQKKIPRYTKVKVEEVNGNYSRVTGLNGPVYGWTASSNLGTYFKDDAALASAALAPASAIAIDPGWNSTRKAIAGVYNRLGGLMQTLASATHIDLAAVLSVWYVESAGRTHTKGKAIIRFEVHVLFGLWGKKHSQEFDLHFQFGTRPPKDGGDCPKPWNCHSFRSGDTGAFQSVHKDQDSEYAALAEATTLGGDEIAVQCLSIGGSQILGSNYQLIGYDTAKQMYDAFQDNERPHVLGFFDYCQFDKQHGALMNHLRKQEWVDFASGYNGQGNAADYSAKLRDAFTAATAVLPAAAAPAKAKSLGVGLGNQPVDLNYPVALIPQPDKLSCWAASMSMLLSHYRQALLTPESLAQQVGMSLRKSYGWETLEAVRRRFLFKEVSLPSNYSYVPPPERWYQWLDQYGPLWITLRGDPSHAVVVAGISGDLTPGNTSIHLLNPWDTRVRFDNDPVEFHPANRGREETLSYDEFSREFGNMGLADYGHWRILYLGRADAVAHGLDVRDLTPEEIADAEPRVLEAWAESAGTRPVLGETDVRWAPDDRSIDYRHLGTAFDAHPFTFTPALLERLCALNRFDVKAGQDEVLFGLRGCQFPGGAAPGGWVDSANLSEALPDHKNARCILGVWKRSTARFRLFTGSTVPNWKLMEAFREGGDHSNMLPTGRYLFQVGTHRAGTKGEVRGAFLEHGDAVVLRTLDDLTYAIGDTWDSGDFGDNIHPARLDGAAHPPFFSSAGCQTVPGNVHDGKHSGKWAEFRAAAGLSTSSPASEDGRRFVYGMFTGRDARLIAAGKPDSALMRLRFGSSGPDVTALQLGLSGAGFLKKGASGTLDAPTKMAYIHWQTARDPHTTDGVVTPSDGASLGFDMIRGQSIHPARVSHALDTRQPTPDEIIAQFDLQRHTSYGSYAGYRKTLVDGKIFGQAASGLRPGFLKKLQAGEAAAAKAIGGSSPSFGIMSVGGFRQSEGFHGWGLAVDLNYHSAPYIMHNRGEGAIDREVGPVYTRIARFLLQRESKIPKEITLDNRTADRISKLYDWLAEESNAMIRYFQLMQDTAKLSTAISSMAPDTDWRPISGGATAPSADAMQEQMIKDYVALAGRGGPAVSGKSYPVAPKNASHRPFHGDPKLRGPEKGFLSIRKEIVVALCAQGLRWGAIHFGGESGDVMHFDDGFSEGALILEAKAAAKKAIAAGQSVDLATIAAGAGCAADIPIDEHSAVIFSQEAPLAKVDCERAAVWAAIPDPLRRPFSLLIYFHGNDAAVLADARHPEGILPKWNRVAKPALTSLTPGGPFAPGTRDELAAAAQSAPQRPLVLTPEDGVPSSQAAFWAETDAGALKGDPAALSRLTDDAWGHLANLKRPSGSPYLPGGPVCPVVRRLFLAGHSGGGLPLGYSASSVMALNIPTDLWLLDCTYYDLDPYVAFCRHWKQKSQLGNDAQSSRMVVITTAGKTRNRAQTILQKLQAAQKGQPGLSAVAFTRGQFTGGTTTPPAGVDIVVVKEDANWPEIDLCLRSFPVIFIETKIAHGRIPHDYFPHLLNTGAVP